MPISKIPPLSPSLLSWSRCRISSSPIVSVVCPSSSGRRRQARPVRATRRAAAGLTSERRIPRETSDHRNKTQVCHGTAGVFTAAKLLQSSTHTWCTRRGNVLLIS